MSATQQSTAKSPRYHADAYRFVFEALHHTQVDLQKPMTADGNDESAHITGRELLMGVKSLARERFGLLAKTVFAYWGIRSTSDFGRIVFDLIERGEMRKTDNDQLSDFTGVYDFQDAFDEEYEIVPPKL